jgi:[ribosomal protein S5]-alanine N-acetyltransferase
MTADDAPRLYEIQSNWHVARMLARASFPPVLASLHSWLASHDGEWIAGTDYRFAVIYDGHIIGCIDINDIRQQCGVLGYWFDEAYWGHGFAKEASTAVVAFALTDIGLKELTATHAEDNPASGRVLASLGFRWIGDVESWSQSRQETIKQRRYSLAAGTF